MSLVWTQLIATISIILNLLQFGPWIALAVSGDAGDVLLFQDHNHQGSRAAMVLPLYRSAPDSSISTANPHRKLQRSESQGHPNAHMRLYDDLLLNGYYTTRLWIGTPPQRFALIVDTGSTVTYVPCSTCVHCGRHQVVFSKHKYSDQIVDVGFDSLALFRCMPCLDSNNCFRVGWAELGI